jgi:predicted dehydrogenase
VKPLTTGFIGAGGIASMHANGLLQEKSLFDIKAVSDVNMANASALADKFHIPDRHADYHHLLADDGIEAVIVLVPHDLHEEICVAAARRGKHILVEKPLARTTDEAERIIAAARAAGVVLMVGHNQRYVPVHRKIKDLLVQGVLGRIYAARAEHWQDFDRPRGNWWRSKEAVGGGCLIGSGIHRLDLLRWFVGEVQEVSAYASFDESRLEGEVAAAVAIRFENGAVGDFYCDWGVHRPWPFGESLSITGTEGGIIWKDGAYLISDRANPRSEKKPIAVAAGEYESMWAHFAECVRTGKRPLTSGEEGRASLALVRAAYRSIETGKPVRSA